LIPLGIEAKAEKVRKRAKPKRLPRIILNPFDETRNFALSGPRNGRLILNHYDSESSF
jgi:hypothetical protein